MSSPTKIDPAVGLRIAKTCGFHRMRRAARVIARRIEAAFAAEEVTPNQLMSLIGLEMTGGAKVQDLADLLGLDHSTLSRTLTPLIEGGWIRQGSGADRRATPLELTDLGRRHAARAIAAWERFQTGLEKALGAKRWARLSEDLDAVLALDEADEAVESVGSVRNSKRRASRQR
jgi:DNA-binding MarR family transcriptional regulator